MGHRRKKRYQSKPNPYPTLTLTGNSCLKDWEDGAIEQPQPGDIQFYLYTCTLGRCEDDPGYDHIGGSGYLKARVWDGREWQLLVMDTLFADKPHHFSRTEMPYDTYLICHDRAKELVGRVLERSYRSHYEPVDDER